MRVPIAWLRDYADLPANADEIIARLATLGFPVDDVETRPKLTNVVSRAYWGSPVLTWGRDGANSMKKIGDVPKPGEWTELRVSPYDLDLEYLDIKFRQ